MHLNDERLQRLIDDELAASEWHATQAHLAVCADCRRRFEDVTREKGRVHELLRSLDTPAPAVSVDAIARRAEAEKLGRAEAAAPGRAGTAAPSRSRTTWLRRAAGFAIVIGIAGAAYAIPGSPVRGWIHDVTRKLTGRPETPAPAPAPGRTGVSGVAVAPGDRLSILFEPGALGAELRIDLTDGSDVQVHGPAGAAAYTSSAGYLLIRGRDSSAVLDVQIPRTAPWVEIRAQDERVFLKEGPRVTTGGSRMGDRYVLPLPGRPAR
jgi:anti-sigma factor RsiW